MAVQICAVTDTGLARAQNEDSVAFDAATGLCILADGMGGHNAGEVASGMATVFIKSELRAWLLAAGDKVGIAAVQAALLQVVDKANGAIFNMSRTSPRYAGMGTTLVVGVFRDDVLALAHIGDSRCYRLRDSQLQQLTRDHSVHQEQIDAGLWIAGKSPSRMEHNLVTRALGVDDQVRTDINRYALAPGDLYLLCSDGLSDMVEDDAIAAMLRSTAPIEALASQLVAAANANGGRDNISVLLAKVGDLPSGGLFDAARKAMGRMWGLGRA